MTFGDGWRHQVYPDSGQKSGHVYDLMGRVRFTKDAVGQYYVKYDVLGRMIEKGTFNSIWDRGTSTRKSEHRSQLGLLPVIPYVRQPLMMEMKPHHGWSVVYGLQPVYNGEGADTARD